jgi:hypothetical protein
MKDFRCISYPLFSSGPDLFIRHIQEGRFANHRMNGIFCGRGPSFKENEKLKNASIMDLAPTLLYLQGEPIYEHMDGELLRPAIQNSLLESDPPEFSSDSNEKGGKDEEGGAGDEAAERLKGLGYLG